MLEFPPYNMAVLGGWLSPSHDTYVEPKCKRFKTPFVPAAGRTKLASLVINDVLQTAAAAASSSPQPPPRPRATAEATAEGAAGVTATSSDCNDLAALSARTAINHIHGRVYLANYFAAKSRSKLTKEGITHVLVAAQELPCTHECDPTLTYKQLQVADNPSQVLPFGT